MNVYARNAAIMRLRSFKLPARVIAALNWSDYTPKALTIDRFVENAVVVTGVIPELAEWKSVAIDTRSDSPMFVAADNRSLGTRLTEQSILKIERNMNDGRF